MSYNRYRHRHYNISKTKARNYAQEMEDLEQQFDQLADWSLSSMKDSAYKYFGDFEIRLSNHSANNQYHDLENGTLLINVKLSKLHFIEFIENELDSLLKKLNDIELTKYRFINVVDTHINCFYKEFKTKKDVFTYDRKEQQHWFRGI